MESQPRAHLVVGQPFGAPLRGSAKKRPRISRVRLIEALIAALEPAGDYAITTETDGGGEALRIAFAKKADADLLADALRAKSVGQYPGWASQRAFALDDRIEIKINKVLSDLFGR